MASDYTLAVYIYSPVLSILGLGGLILSGVTWKEREREREREINETCAKIETALGEHNSQSS
jgi:hypothetical protein